MTAGDADQQFLRRPIKASGKAAQIQFITRREGTESVQICPHVLVHPSDVESCEHANAV